MVNPSENNDTSLETSIVSDIKCFTYCGDERCVCSAKYIPIRVESETVREPNHRRDMFGTK